MVREIPSGRMDGNRRGRDEYPYKRKGPDERKHKAFALSPADEELIKELQILGNLDAPRVDKVAELRKDGMISADQFLVWFGDEKKREAALKEFLKGNNIHLDASAPLTLGLNGRKLPYRRSRDNYFQGNARLAIVATDDLLPVFQNESMSRLIERAEKYYQDRPIGAPDIAGLPSELIVHWNFMKYSLEKYKNAKITNRIGPSDLEVGRTDHPNISPHQPGGRE